MIPWHVEVSILGLSDGYPMYDSLASRTLVRHSFFCWLTRCPAGGFQSRRAVGVVGCWVFICAMEWCFHAKTCQNDWGILGVWWSHQSIMWVDYDWVRLTSQKHTYAYIRYTLWVLFLATCSKHAHPLLVANRCIHVIIYTYYIYIYMYIHTRIYTLIHAYVYVCVYVYTLSLQ